MATRLGKKVIKDTQVKIINEVQKNFNNNKLEDDEYLQAANNTLFKLEEDEKKY